jgi:hypothetical protein
MPVGPEERDQRAKAHRRDHPLQAWFFALSSSVNKIEIYQFLIRQPGLICQTLKVVDDFQAQIDSHCLLPWRRSGSRPPLSW